MSLSLALGGVVRGSVRGIPQGSQKVDNAVPKEELSIKIGIYTIKEGSVRGTEGASKEQERETKVCVT